MEEIINAFKTLPYLSSVKFPGSDELPQVSERIHIVIKRPISIISAFIETKEMLET